MELKAHPLADLFPMMGADELAAMSADIRANGQREPIVLHNGLILDGRNRYRACSMARVKPITEEWNGKGDITAYVVSMNLRRRHLDEGQRGMVAAKLANMRRQDTLKRGPDGSKEPSGISTEQAANLLNVSPSTVKRAKVVLAKGTSEEVAAVQDGKASVTAISSQIHAGMTPEQRKAAREQVSTRRPRTKKVVPLSERGKNPERIQTRQMRSMVWSQVKEALEHLTSLPKPADVVLIVRGMPKAAPIVEERLSKALSYLGELQDAWNSHEAA